MAASYNWRSLAGEVRVDVATPEGQTFGGMDLADAMLAAMHVLRHEGLLDHHPLVRWFRVTGEPAAQSLGRVPASIARTPRVQELYEVLDQFGIRTQLSIPVFLDGMAHEAFVLAGSERGDFSNEDFQVARRIQGFLRALRAQTTAVAGLVATPSPPDDLLTGRECAVPALAWQGCTATAIGHRLGMSPRTASKHLENVYRKLGVRDRVTACRVAQELGYDLPPTTSARTDEGQRSG